MKFMNSLLCVDGIREKNIQPWSFLSNNVFVRKIQNFRNIPQNTPPPTQHKHIIDCCARAVFLIFWFCEIYAEFVAQETVVVVVICKSVKYLGQIVQEMRRTRLVAS
jgi:hypothetical protein